MANFRSKNEQSEKQHDAADTPALSSDGSHGNEKTGNTLHLVNGLNGTGATAASGIEPEKERKLLRKIDLIVIPWVCLLYLSSFLDRVNIGNARLYGLEEDLSMTGSQFQIAVAVLFPTYVVFELPSNLVLKHYVRPSRWIAFITTSWGLIATLSGFTQSYAGLLACRVLLGLFEAGLFPGCVVYLTFFYTRREIALRTAYLFVAAALAGAFGGLLAFAIGYMDGLQGLSGWRWIFIIEGIPTVILGIGSWFYMADDAHTAYFLNEEERALVLARRKAQVGVSETFEWADALKGLKDWKTYTFAFCQFCNCCMLYSYNTFLPTIIFEIMPDAGRAAVQLLTIPCYACGAIAYLAGAWFSDRVQIRGATTACFGAASVVGYALLISPVPPGVLYAGSCIVGLGIYAALGLPIAWLNSNNPRYGKRTAASGTHISLGNIAGVVAPFLYPDSDAPYYRPGHGSNMALVAAAACTYFGMFLFLTWENKQRLAGKRDHRMEGKSEEEIEAMGDESPRYLYSRFLYIKNFGVDQELCDKVCEQGIKFFDLPDEEKLRIEMKNQQSFLGYSRLGNEITAQKADWREQIDLSTPHPVPKETDPLYHHLLAPNQWPRRELLPDFQPNYERYIAEMSTVSMWFTSLIAESLDLPPTAFDRFFDEDQQHKLKIVKYPDSGDGVGQGVGPHKDSMLTSYLLQASPHKGLQAQNVAGEWIDCPPIRGTLVVAIGQGLEALTGGVCASTTHRVISPKGGEGARFSIPFFQGVSYDASFEEMTVPDHVRDLRKDVLEREGGRRDHVEFTFRKGRWNHLGEATLMNRVKSHPDVSERWYPDLLAQIRRQQAEEAAAQDKAAMTTSNGTLAGMPAQASSIEAH